MQVLVTINDPKDFAKLLTNEDIHKHNFAVVIDKRIKLAYRDWQYQNYVAIKERFEDPVYVYDYGDYEDMEPVLAIVNLFIISKFLTNLICGSL